MEGQLFSVSEELFWGAGRRMRRWRWGGPQAHVRGFGQANSIKLCRYVLARSSGCDKKRERMRRDQVKYTAYMRVLQQLGSLLGFMRAQHHGPPNAQTKCLFWSPAFTRSIGGARRTTATATYYGKVLPQRYMPSVHVCMYVCMYICMYAQGFAVAKRVAPLLIAMTDAVSIPDVIAMLAIACLNTYLQMPLGWS